MSYEINKYSGQTLTIIPDGVEDTSTSLKLLGKGVPTYGEATAENFVHLMENFAGYTAPLNPIKGQLWYHLDAGGSGVHVLKICRTESPVQWTEISTTPINSVFVQKSGDVMSGPLTIVEGTSPNHAVSKGYVDNLFGVTASSGYVSRGGDTMTGALLLQNTETQYQNSTTGNLSSIKSHQSLNMLEVKSFNGGIIFNTNNEDRWAANDAGHIVPIVGSQYDIGSAGLPVRAVYANNIYGNIDLLNGNRENIQDLVGAMMVNGSSSGIVVTYDDSLGVVNMAVAGGGSSVGAVDTFLDLTDTPNSYLNANGYFLTVESSTNSIIFTDPTDTFLQLSGGTMSGPLVLNSDPIVNMQAATKQYVDNKVASVGAGGGAAVLSEGSVVSKYTAASTNFGFGSYVNVFSATITVTQSGTILINAGGSLSVSCSAWCTTSSSGESCTVSPSVSASIRVLRGTTTVYGGNIGTHSTSSSANDGGSASATAQVGGVINAAFVDNVTPGTYTYNFEVYAGYGGGTPSGSISNKIFTFIPIATIS